MDLQDVFLQWKSFAVILMFNVVSVSFLFVHSFFDLLLTFLNAHCTLLLSVWLVRLYGKIIYELLQFLVFPYSGWGRRDYPRELENSENLGLIPHQWVTSLCQSSPGRTLKSKVVNVPPQFQNFLSSFRGPQIKWVYSCTGMRCWFQAWSNPSSNHCLRKLGNNSCWVSSLVGLTQ